MSVLEQGCADSVKLRTGLKGVERVRSQTRFGAAGVKQELRNKGLIMR